MTVAHQFNYIEAFSRNIGWVTEAEQQLLRTKKIAIAGMGGVGGVHLLTLVRLGIGAFHIADFDTFEVGNFNRQVGATMSSLGRAKAHVLEEMARDINPELHITPFVDGVDDCNLSAFLEGVDLYVDGLDFFVLDMRARVFARCAQMGIPAITAAPLGMGTAYLMFMPGGMTFEEYFRLEGLPKEHQYVNFLVGLSPKAFHRSYLADPSCLNLAAQRGPSTIMACELCAGVTGVEVLKILLNRGKIYAAPYYHHFDAYQGKWIRGWLPGGNSNPLQRLKRRIGYRTVERQMNNIKYMEISAYLTEIEKILDVARWAPSGDNAQPWRFEVIADDKLIVHVISEAHTNVYEYNDGQPSFISIGFLLENIRIAASHFDRSFKWSYRSTGQHEHLIDVEIPKQPGIIKDPLLPFLTLRSVDRRPYKMRSLTLTQQQALTASLGNNLEIRWFETFSERWLITRLNTFATEIRLSIREAFDVHQRILDWKREYSAEAVPVKAVGLDPLTLKTMKWVMQDWKRMHFMNRFLGGTITPRVELDILPGLFCAAHFIVMRKDVPPEGSEIPSFIRTGQSLQRFWLTATQLGLVMQPSLAPLCFAYYGKHQVAFTSSAAMRDKAKNLAIKLAQACGGQDTDNLLFMGRMGVPSLNAIKARSIRRPLSSLRNTAKATSE